MLSDYPQSLPHRISFVLLPGYSLIGFSSLVEPLRWANSIEGKSLYSWELLSVDGEPVAASNGMLLTTDNSIRDAAETDAVIVCSGFDPQKHKSNSLFSALRRFNSFGVDIGGHDTGTYILAAAGLLNGYRATIHWENLDSFAEEFPGIQLVKDLFEIDRSRFSCSGGLAGLDMMLHVIQRQHGQDLAHSVSDKLIYSQIRGGGHPQQLSPQLRFGVTQPKIVAAIKIMQQNLENLATIPELAAKVYVSTRELERLFRKHLDKTPSAFYRDLRLERAQQLLQQTSRNISNIAVSCGFTSSSHFSRCYQSRFSCSPSKDRHTKS